MAITGYHTSGDNSNSQQQPMAGYRKQVNCYQARMSQEKRKHHKRNVYVTIQVF